MKVKILDERITPNMLSYQTKGSAGIDLYALPNENIGDNFIIANRYSEFKTGIAVEIPEGYVGIIVPRSSIGSSGIMLANTVGVIDSDYRGEILFRLVAWSLSTRIRLDQPLRVAQLLIMPVNQVNIEIVKELPDTERGENGFGSTGKE